MWQIRIDKGDGSVIAERVPDDVAWLEVISETRIRIWSASFGLARGWFESAWLDDAAWINDYRFAGPRTVLRDLITKTPSIPGVRAVRLIADLTARGAIVPPVPPVR